MPRTHSLAIVALAALGLLSGCGGVPATPSVFSAPPAPIARAFTPTPALAPGSRPTRVPPAQPATPAPIAAQAVPIGAPVSVAPPAQLDPLGRSLDAYLNDIVNAGWFQGAVLVARNGKVILSKGY